MRRHPRQPHRGDLLRREPRIAHGVIALDHFAAFRRMDQSSIATIIAAAITAVATIVAAWLSKNRHSATGDKPTPKSGATKRARNDTPNPHIPYAIASIAIGQATLAYVSFARLPLTAGTVGLCIEAGVFVLLGFWLFFRD